MLLMAVLVIGWMALAVMLLYLLLLMLAAARPCRTVVRVNTQRTFRIIIPAHNEELVLEPVLHRLMSLRYPRSKFDVIVIADNCSDRTAEVARRCGARVLERIDEIDRGKGHALAYAFTQLRAEQFDAYVILDADTLVGPTLLAVLNQYLDAGHRVIQGHYDVLNPYETSRTTLMYLAFRIFNYVRPLGRRALGLSTGLKGNGMCFTKSVIDRHPWNAFSLAEDIEYTTILLTNGVHIVFAPEVHIWAQMPANRTQATTQRIRWEAGRLQLARRDGLRLILQGLRHRDPHIFDWGMDLAIPPLAAFALMILGGLGTAAGALLYSRTPATIAVVLAWSVLFAALGLFVLGSMVVGRLPKQAFTALLQVPGYVAWKLWIYAVMVVRRTPQQWIRTERARIHDHEECNGKY